VIKQVGGKLSLVGILVLFSYLMAQDLCPSWFLGIIVTTYLLQFSGWLYLKLYHPHWNLLLPYQTLWYQNRYLQLGWGCFIMMRTLIFGSHLHSWWDLISFVDSLVFLVLSAVHIYVFYTVIEFFKPLLLVESASQKDF
jgi:hypothetical protein